MLVIICILISAGAGAAAWYGAGLIGLAPEAAAALSVSLTANLSAMCALLLIWRDQSRVKEAEQRMQRFERHSISTARAIKTLPTRTKEMFRPLESRLAQVERLAVAAREEQAAADAAPCDTLGEEIAAVTAAMNKTVAQRASEADAEQRAIDAPNRVTTATAMRDDEPAPKGDELASAVEGLVARYTKKGKPRRLAAPAAVNQNPRPQARMEDARASLKSASSAAERLATTLLQQTLKGNGLEVKLNPICRIANRRVIWQEATSQLGGGAKGLLTPADYLPLAGAAGMMPEHDTHLVRAVAETLRSTPGNMRLFVNLHPASLTVPGPIDALTRAIEADPTVPQRLVLEFAQDDVKTMGEEDIRGLSTLARLGFDLSMDGVEDLRLDWRAMARQGFRFVKVPAHVLCGGHAGIDVHPADLGALLDRHGLSLIAEGVDGEGRLLQLADHDVPFAQGRLFASALANDPRFAQETRAA